MTLLTGIGGQAEARRPAAGPPVPAHRRGRRARHHRSYGYWRGVREIDEAGPSWSAPTATSPGGSAPPSGTTPKRCNSSEALTAILAQPVDKQTGAHPDAPEYSIRPVPITVLAAHPAAGETVSTSRRLMTDRPYTSVWRPGPGRVLSGIPAGRPLPTRYLHAGDDLPVLLMPHGITGHAEAYVRNLRAHAEHFSCWAIDFIGHGYSSKPDHPLEIPHYIDQVNHVLDVLGRGRPTSPASPSAAGSPPATPSCTRKGSSGSCSTPWAAPWPTRRSWNGSTPCRWRPHATPSWERVKARLEWLMADPSMVTDDLIKTRQMIFQQPDWPRACEMNMALQDLETRKRNMLTDDDLRSIQAPALVLWTTKDPPGRSTRPSGSPR